MITSTFLKTIIVAILSLHSAAGGCPSEDEMPKILNGAPAPCGRYPYVVSLRAPRIFSHSCGGVLIDPEWVLTSGSCLKKISPGPIEVYIGGWGINEAEEIREGIIVENDAFNINQPLAGKDLGLLKLSEKSDIQPAQLPTSALSSEEKLTAIGWGRLSRSSAFAALLNEGSQQKVIPRRECSVRHKFNIEKLLCAGIEGSTCAGDEGSALLQVRGDNPADDIVVGIALSAQQFGSDCHVPGKPGIFTNVWANIEWIEEQISS